MRGRKLWKILLLVFSFLLFVAPLLYMFLKSVSYGWTWPNWRPDSLNFRAWEVIFRDPSLIVALKMTICVGVAVVLLNFLIALPAAVSLSRYNFKCKTMIEAILMLPILIPVLAIAMGMHLSMIKLGLADRMSGVILIHLMPTLPYAVRVLKSGFDRLGTNWEEQAIVLGIKRWKIFWTVTLPLMLPSLRSMAILVFVISLSQYVLTAIIGGGKVLTLPMLYYPFFNSSDEAVVAGFSVLFSILPILFLLCFEAFVRCYLFVLKRP